MRNVYLCLLGLALFAAADVSFAQDAEAPADEPSAESVATNEEDGDSSDDEATDGELDDLDDADLDLQTYDQDDDEFVPTEEVPADQAIPFPSDI